MVLEGLGHWWVGGYHRSILASVKAVRVVLAVLGHCWVVMLDWESEALVGGYA